jgi:hypothetical protein
VILRLFLMVGRDVIVSNLPWPGRAQRRAPSAALALHQVPLDLRDANGLARCR